MAKKQENTNTISTIQLRKQYLRDCSFENPNAPQCFTQQVQPKINIALNLKSTDLSENQCELNLFVEASAKHEEDSIFLAAIQYCGVFELPEGIEPEKKQELMLIDAAATLFPYARHVIAKLTLEGGFPSLDLGHIDFANLYMQKKQNGEIAKFGGEDGGVEDDGGQDIKVESANNA